MYTTNRDPWLQRQFQRDKLRVKERYWRYYKDNKNKDTSTSFIGGGADYIVIPDGLCWRKYLGLIRHIVQEQQVPDQQQLPQLRWLLLESAVEFMDWRNSSPSIPRAALQHQRTEGEGGEGEMTTMLVRESAAPRERTKMLQLLSSEDEEVNCVHPFCDLSLREQDPEWDDFHILGYSKMSISERSQHALIRAARMIQQGNSSSQQQKVVVISCEQEDKEHYQALLQNEQQAGDDDFILVVEMDGFLDLLFQHNHQNTQELDARKKVKIRCEEDYFRANQAPLILNTNTSADNSTSTSQEEYLSEEQVQEGLRNGELVKGRLEVSKENPKEAFVVVTTAQQQIRYFVNQRLGHFNRSLHNDMVILKPLPQSEWGRPVGRRKLVHNNPTADDDEDVDKDNDEDIPAVPSARVVAIAASSTQRRTSYVATLVDIPMHNDNNNAILLVPMDVRIPKIRVSTKSWKKYRSQRLLVEIDGWDIGSNYPHGRVSEIIGPIGDLEVEIKCLLMEHEIVLDPFSAAATACLPPQGSSWTVPEQEILNRRDLRHTRRIFSVDPPGCQDIDDTMHAHALPNGDVEVGCHIADVTFFVPHQSPLDKEAQKRGTTFYLVDRRFDMLPSLLSSDLCSLHGNVDRLAVSVIWTLSSDLDTVKDVWYGRTVMHNCQAMTYEQAHNILHDKPPDDPNKPDPPPLTAGYKVKPKQIPALKQDLTILRDLSRKLKKRREEVGGAVDLSSGDMGGELKFTLDENGNPTAVKPKQELEIHNTIAEMMIFANGYVASKIFESFPDSALLRIHRTVEESRFQDLKEMLDVGGVSLEGSSNRALANTLKSVDKAGTLVNSLIKSLATRAMSEAQYISTGDRDGGLDLSHYGLGVDRYTHFTSPIRRYADVIVHKQLLAALFKEQNPTSKGSYDNATPVIAEPERPALPSLPDSNVISIMEGEGLETSVADDLDLDCDDFLDSLIEGASELALGTDRDNLGEECTGRESEFNNNVGNTVSVKDIGSEVNRADESSETRQDSSAQPYDGSEVSRIADSLNRQNRMAKLSSMECQKLFLSLYFRDHTETVQGVVTNLRVNGFFVYIPEFDISGPVYVQDVNGDVQIDPAFIGLSPEAGLPPTLGFASSSTCRRFPNGVCELIESSDGSASGSRLEVRVQEGKRAFAVRTVDVVTLCLRCDEWDVKSRIPPPCFQLVAKDTVRAPPGFRQVMTSKKIGAELLQKDSTASKEASGGDRPKDDESRNNIFQSVFDVMQSVEIQPVLKDIPLRSVTNRSNTSNAVTRQEDFKGRLVYGNFINPDSKSATQEAAISAASEAASQRRANAMETDSRRNEYDRAQNIERNIMARTQRLAAEKRNVRKSKNK